MTPERPCCESSRECSIIDDSKLPCCVAEADRHLAKTTSGLNTHEHTAVELHFRRAVRASVYSKPVLQRSAWGWQTHRRRAQHTRTRCSLVMVTCKAPHNVLRRRFLHVHPCRRRRRAPWHRSTQRTAPPEYRCPPHLVLTTRAETEPAPQIRQEMVRCTPLLAQPQQTQQKLV